MILKAYIQATGVYLAFAPHVCGIPTSSRTFSISGSGGIISCCDATQHASYC